ncbi:capsid protein [Peromfec virus RodF8_96]|uniref:Capsid protein n=1 Tax=Peromfec virus RodF8_96 TaxID=2929260 RepID=A0A976N2K8_9VIRU|nr:capsid protein [Peromfec virus RodF8_96]
MAKYGRRSKRSYKRRNRTLSKSNVLLNKGAKSQARQIYALSRKVNRVYNKVKPEYKVVNSVSVYSFKFTSSSLSSVIYQIPMSTPLAGSSSEGGMIGDKCRMISYVMNGYCEYFNSSNTGYHDTESAGAVVRVIALQDKDASSKNPILTVDQILQDAGRSGDNYTALAFSPFKLGITNRVRVLMDYRTTMTTTRNQKLLKLRIPLHRFRDLRYEANELNAWTNYIRIYVIVGGLHYDSNYNETVQFTATTKLVYTDV